VRDKTIAVLGAGLMGVGIATQFARHGYRTMLFDVSPARLEDAKHVSGGILDELIDAGCLDARHRAAILSQLSSHVDIAPLADAHFVIEAIPENLALKHETYARIEPRLRTDAVLASNASGFPPDQLAEALGDPARFLIAHFWNPPHMIPLVEVVPGTQTAAEAVHETVALMQAIAMEPVVLAKAIPGFVGNRLQFAVLREALAIVRSGAASPEVVDTVMKASLGRRYSVMGPFEAADLGGLDTLADVATHLMPVLAKDEEVIDLMRRHVDAGEVGARSGQGFYCWDVERMARVRAARKQLIR
jgi:3-hydroxybutyryl-CoA dehydrogenase